MQYNLFDYKIVVFFDKEDGDYVAYIDEIPHVSAFGDTPDSAIKELETAFSLWLEAMNERKFPIPKPYNKMDRENELKSYSGKFSLRMPRPLHKKLAELAKIDGVSINQEAVYRLTKAIYS